MTAPPLTVPGFIRRRVEREIEDAIHPKGMSVHDGKTRIHATDAQRLLSTIDALESANAELRARIEAMAGLLNKASETLFLMAEFDPTYPPQTAPVNTAARMWIELHAALKELT